jgi:RNA polymerase sigma factor (sigma-70 family)
MTLDPVDDVALLIDQAVAGDQAAWTRIIERYAGRVWAICRVYRLSPADAADVFQQTWLRVLENLRSVREPDRLGAWIGTTCRHEALAAFRRSRRSQPVGDTHLFDRPTGPADDPDHATLVADRDAELWRAFRQLNGRCQDVLRVLVLDAEDRRPSYGLAAAALDMPIGSLGPTRARCLTRLREFVTEGIGGESGAS